MMQNPTCFFVVVFGGVRGLFSLNYELIDSEVPATVTTHLQEVSFSPTMARWFALPPHRKKVLGLVAGLGSLMWRSSEFSPGSLQALLLPPTLQNMQMSKKGSVMNGYLSLLH